MFTIFQDYGFVLKIFNDQVLRPPELQRKTANATGVKQANEQKSAGMPIIIVPNSASCSISVLNALDFLERGEFISSEEKKQSGAKRMAEQVVQRVDPITGVTKNYKLIDNPINLSPQDWDRVVVVFVSGQLWQFKGWKWPAPVDLFRNVLGVYLTFDNRAIDTTVQSWNCKVIKVFNFNL